MKNIDIKELKHEVKAFVFDFDGTIKSSAEPDCNPLNLIEKIGLSSKSVGIVTASGVSVLMGLAKQIKNTYLGIANGMALYKIDDQGIREIYNYPIEFEDTKIIIEVWKKVMKNIGVEESDLVQKGLVTFNEFLNKDWGEYISKEYLDISREYNGMCFVEKLKATFVMPRNEVFSQEKFVELMQEEIDNTLGIGKYIIDMGDNVFAHVTGKPNMAPKLFALKKIQKELGLTDNEIVTIGDMPLGNDRGLLIESDFPYTFTNKHFDGEDVNNPPFVLSGSDLTPVANVYKFVESLLS